MAKLMDFPRHSKWLATPDIQVLPIFSKEGALAESLELAARGCNTSFHPMKVETCKSCLIQSTGSRKLHQRTEVSFLVAATKTGNHVGCPPAVKDDTYNCIIGNAIQAGKSPPARLQPSKRTSYEISCARYRKTQSVNGAPNDIMMPMASFVDHSQQFIAK